MDRKEFHSCHTACLFSFSSGATPSASGPPVLAQLRRSVTVGPAREAGGTLVRFTPALPPEPSSLQS